MKHASSSLHSTHFPAVNIPLYVLFSLTVKVISRISVNQTTRHGPSLWCIARNWTTYPFLPNNLYQRYIVNTLSDQMISLAFTKQIEKLLGFELFWTESSHPPTQCQSPVFWERILPPLWFFIRIEFVCKIRYKL